MEAEKTVTQEHKQDDGPDVTYNVGLTKEEMRLAYAVTILTLKTGAERYGVDGDGNITNRLIALSRKFDLRKWGNSKTKGYTRGNEK